MRRATKASRLSRRPLGLVVALSGAAVAVLVAAACVGDDPTITNAGNDGGGISPDAIPSLNCPLECLPPAPPGWSGPSAVYDGPPESMPAACPVGYTLRELEAHQGLSAPPASCECAAGEVRGAKCEIRAISSAGAFCMQDRTDVYEVPDAGCVQLIPSITTLVKPPVVVLDAATCTFPPATRTLPPFVSEKVNLSCGLTRVAPCPERADCVFTPAPEFGRLCIYKHGEELCPSHDYPARFVAYAKVNDERDCAPCSGSPRGGNCGDASDLLLRESNCMGGSVRRPFEACISANEVSPRRYADLSVYAPTDVECPAHEGEAVGEATSEDPVTFCCTR